MSTKWLEWAKRIQSLSQAGLTYSKDVYDMERFEELRTISTEIMAEHTEVEMEKIKDLFASEKGYQTPKMDVRGAVFRDGKILLVKEKVDNKWALPGGFCDIGLSPSENIVKEIREESGFLAVPVKLLALLDMNQHGHPPQPYHYYKLFVQCEIVGGRASFGVETDGVEFFSAASLPELSLNRNTEAQIEMLFSFLHHPEKAAILD